MDKGRPFTALRRLRPRILALATSLLLLGCAAHFPQSTAGSLPFSGRADSLFLSPLAVDRQSGFIMDRRLDKSRGQAEDYLRVWLAFLAQECERRGQVLVLPRRTDSLAVASFHCAMDDAAWLGMYGIAPGDDSRVVSVKALRLQAIKRNFFEKLLSTLNLSDDTGHEFGWLELDYEVYDLELDEGSGPRRLVSREPDDPFVSNHMDRAGRLMMRGARDLARGLDQGQNP